jgi:hypothetical protein
MRISSLIPVLLALAACSSERDGQAPGAAASSASEAARAEERIDCALAGAEAFTRDCVVERAPQDGVLYLVVRHPDGAFRRFQVLKDGRGIAAADGAKEAETRLDRAFLEVTVGNDRYRFPATQKRHAPTS